MTTEVADIIRAADIRTADLDDDELVETAIVLLKINGPDGTHLRLCWPDGQSWMERVGMLAIAHNEELSDTDRGDQP